MKLVVLSMNFAPELTGIGKYSGEMVDGLADQGHDIRVVCAPPYYPAWEVQDAYSSSRYSVRRPRPNVTVYRCPLWVPRSPSGAKRLLHQASFVLACLPVMLWLALMWRPRVVLAVAPATFCAPVAWLAARLAGAKAWLHVQDLELDAAFGLGLLQGRRLQKVFLALERRLLRRFDRVTTISRRMLRQLACKGVDLAKADLVPNWVNLGATFPIQEAQSRNPLREMLGVGPTQKLVLFSGTMNRKQGLAVLIAAAQKLQHRDDIVFVLCGAGEMKAALQQAAADLHNVRFMGLQPSEQFNQLLNLADIHLLPQLRGAADLVLPSKLCGMLASGRAVIAATEAGSEIAGIVQHCGLRVEPENADAFAEAIVTLCGDDVLRARLGQAARLYAESALGFDRAQQRLEAGFAVLARAEQTFPAWPEEAALMPADSYVSYGRAAAGTEVARAA
jgi:colanic acid biosynthesis glycosyl transferase WcaI